MPDFYNALFVAIATRIDKKLAGYLHYLKTENEILRAKAGRVTVNSEERSLLMEAARGLEGMLKNLVKIVHYSTMLRWFREEKQGKKHQKRGRKRKPPEIRQLVIEMARANIGGYDRIVAELQKLGIRSVSKSTVKRILKEEGLAPFPKRSRERWDEYLKRHWDSLWQCDFMSRKILTPTGFRTAFVLVFIHVKTRQVIVSPATRRPDTAWVVGQAEAFLKQAEKMGLRVELVQHDRDAKFPDEFRDLLKKHGVEGLRNAVAAPMMNAYVERMIQSIQSECLDHFLIFGTKHLDYLNAEYLTHYHEERPHQGLGNRPIRGGPEVPEVDVVPLSEVRCKKRLSGLLKSYYRQAA